MTQRQAIVLSAGLVLLVILALHYQEQRDAEPEAPDIEVVEPDEEEEGSSVLGPIALYKNVSALVTYARRMQKAFQLAADEMAKAELPRDMVGEMPKPLFDAHATTCPQCGSKYSLVPLCPEGLALLQQDMKNAEQPEPVAEVWWHDATLVFYRPGQLAEREANRMHRAGMNVFRVPNTRRDLYAQFRVDTVPTYLTFQAGREIRRSGAPCSTGGCP